MGQFQGFQLPDHLRFVQLLRPMTVGDRVCAAGDVVAVKPPGVKPRTLMPVDPMLYADRADTLIREKLAKPHPGPATVELGHSLRKPVMPSAGQSVEQEVVLAPRRSEQATGAPQRRQGAI